MTVGILEFEKENLRILKSRLRNKLFQSFDIGRDRKFDPC
ncbi:unnamed protein product [Paramecium primaurelia]|uniref:Uncharacterized protein n=1 Tax=Paramecium primaurelia TaxID=5886 RepID=A0A8S1P6Y4_PARPR|nr:unnamed protein product [Paramecium primaurelia]